MRQTQLVIAALRRCAPSIRCQVVVIRTHGDELGGHGIAPTDGQGLFVRRIEEALLAGTIDAAVHSFKDLPSLTPPGLRLAALPPREDPRDALVSRHGLRLSQLPPRARVGTSSPRRRALLRALRPDLEIVPLRGNVDTRLRRASTEFDAIVVAAAGLRRLERSDEATELLDPSVFVPAVGQGILAIEVRDDDERTVALTAPLDDPTTRACASAERAAARAVGASCDLPFGAYARTRGPVLTVDAFVARADTEPLLRVQAEGPLEDAERIGAEVGAQLRASR